MTCLSGVPDPVFMSSTILRMVCLSCSFGSVGDVGMMEVDDTTACAWGCVGGLLWIVGLQFLVTLLPFLVVGRGCFRPTLGLWPFVLGQHQQSPLV